MSGAETIAILGVVGSIISILDGAKQVYDAAKNAQGLPAAFRDVANRIPIVQDILESARQNLDTGNIDQSSFKGVRDVVNACDTKAKRLNDLFQKASPTGSSSDLARYYKAVKAYGRGNEVESLMKGILEDVQLLACDHGMKVATESQQATIAQAITDVSDIQPSVPEDVFQETGFTAYNSGPGTQFNAQGDYIAQGTARQYNTAGGNMTFGRD